MGNEINHEAALELINKVAQIEINTSAKDYDYKSMVLQPILTSAEDYYYKRVEPLIQKLEYDKNNLNRNQRMANPTKSTYKTKYRKETALENRKRTEDVLREGLVLMNVIREKITNESITYRTFIEDKNKEGGGCIVNIPYINFLNTFTNDKGSYFLTKLEAHSNIMKNELKFSAKTFINAYNTYRQEELQKINQENGEIENKKEKDDWLKSSKIFYFALLEELKKRKASMVGTGKRYPISAGNLFEYVDKIDVSRKADLQDPEKRGTNPWWRDRDKGVQFIFSQAQLYDNVISSRGGDTLEFQDKLLNASVFSLNNVKSIFMGYSGYPGIIPTLRDLVQEKTSEQEIIKQLMNLFTDQAKNRQFDIKLYETLSNTAVENIRTYIENSINGSSSLEKVDI